MNILLRNYNKLIITILKSITILTGAIAAYSIGKLDLNWYKIGDLFFGIGSILAGAVLMACFYIRIMWFTYAFYIIYGCLYQTMLTVAEYIIHNIEHKKYESYK